ncbi:MAG TPA: rhomboid family intramembrane serine protease [Rudaea sp.]
MLILPLHRQLTRSNFPVATVALILINCFVFLFLQSGDGRVEARARDYYSEVHLDRIEFPAYRAWVREHPPRDARRRELMEDDPSFDAMFMLIESDEAFLAALHDGRVIDASRAGFEAWQTQRAEFDRLLDSAFTRRFELRFSHIEPKRMFAAMFLHGGFEHLIGNMIFLALLGILVEGALGSALFLALYLLGGIGAQLVSLAWHWGDSGAALGASGAIAALVGAYCVLWGRRRVRVFYWFFIVFDYVRVPALVLLPLWLGWQLFNLWFNRDARVGFDAHAGGIVAGALLAFALQRRGWVRADFIEEDERSEQHARNETAFDEALGHLGRLDVTQARALLERIDAEEPGQLRVLVALYRCVRYGGGTPAQIDAAAMRVFAFAAKNDADIRELKLVWDDYLKSCNGTPRLAPAILLRLVAPMLRIGQDGAAETLLRGVAAREPNLPTLPAAWFTLALRTPEGTPQRRTRLEYIVQHHGASDFAPKARFLLQQG